MLALAVVVIALLTLTPMETVESLPVTCIVCGPVGGVDLVLNVFLFVPIGVAIAMLGGRNWHALVIGFLMTLAIESLQLTVVAGRFASLGDVLANTLGSTFGFWLAIRAGSWIRATRMDARRLSAASALVVSGIILGSGALLLPSVPASPQYIQWMPVFPATMMFPGRLLSAELNTQPLKAMEWLPGSWNPERFGSEFNLRTGMEGPDSITERRAVILRVANPSNEAVMLAQHGGRVLYRSNIGASALKLRPPLVALKNAFPTASDFDGTVMIQAISNPRAITVRKQQGEENAHVTVRRTAGLGWVLLSPRDFALTDAWWVVNAMWLGALAFPVSFFSRRSGMSNRGIVATLTKWSPATLVVTSLAITVVVMGLSIPGPGEFVGLLVGWGAGWWTDWLLAAGRLATLSESTIELIEE